MKCSLVLFLIFAVGLAVGAPSKHPLAGHIEYKQTQTGDENYALHIKNVYLTLPDLSKLILGPVYMDSPELQPPPEFSDECLPPYCYNWSTFTLNTTKKPLEIAPIEEPSTEKQPTKVESVVILEEEVIPELSSDSSEHDISTELPRLEELEVINEDTPKKNDIEVTPSESAPVPMESSNSFVVMEIEPQSQVLSIKKNDKESVGSPPPVPIDLSRVPIRAEDAVFPEINAQLTLGSERRPISKLGDRSEVQIPVKVVLDARSRQ